MKTNTSAARAAAACAGAALLCSLVAAAGHFVPALAFAKSLFWLAVPLLAGIFCFCAAAGMRNAPAVYALITLGSLGIAVFFGEIYCRTAFSLVNPGNRNDAHNSRYIASGEAAGPFRFVPDPVLGYVNPKGQALALREMHGTDISFDIFCTLDADGRRISPQRGAEAREAVLLFGDSFTFGDGVNDTETFAYRLAELLPTVQVFNYAVSGYGAHQLPAALESGRVDTTALRQRYDRIHAFFLTIQDHPRRALGPFSRGPAYELHDGKAVRVGVHPAREKNLLRDIIASSALLERLNYAIYSRIDPALHIALLREAGRRFAEADIDFSVIVWPDFRQLEEHPAARGLATLSLSQAPGFAGRDWSTTPAEYRVSPSDRHPNAAAHAIIAREIAEYLQQPR